MRLARLIRHPVSLWDAEQIFIRMIQAEGYVIESDLQSYWQDDLFGGPPDAYVQANIRKA